jgi:hypothetical protein
MVHKRTRRDAVSIDNDALLRSEVFSEACRNSLKILAIVCELAYDGGFVSLDELYATDPEIIERYCGTARAALRGLQKLEEREKRLKPTTH